MKKKIIVLICLTLLFNVTNTNAQIFGYLKEKAINLGAKKLAQKITRQPITTCFEDCDTKNIIEPDKLTPSDVKKICKLNLTEQGYLLSPGYYTIHAKSFCLKAGTYGPSKGDGYLYAPLKGPKEDLVKSIIKNWKNHQDIPQSEIQALLWAIIAKTKFNKMPKKMQTNAILLLSKSDKKSLKKLGMDYINLENIQKVIGEFPKPVQTVIEAENKIRQLFSTKNYSYNELEKIAIITGINPEVSSIKKGTWSKQPKGFYTSYVPISYTNVVVKIYVPENINEVYYIPSDDIAVPAATGSQRLAISDVIKTCE